MFIQSCARPFVLFITPTPVTVMLKHVLVVLLPGTAPPVPLNVCACKKNVENVENKTSKYDFINKLLNPAIKLRYLVFNQLIYLQKKAIIRSVVQQLNSFYINIAAFNICPYFSPFH
jgi:hypothetical protein